MQASKGIFIAGAKRTPFGSFGGSLKAFTGTDLATLSSVGAMKQAKVDPSAVDAVFVGNVIQSSPDAAYMARHVGLRAEVPQGKPAITVNRLCGSGFETVCMGAEAIMLGQAEVTLCGGSENMSAAPFTMDGNAARWGVPLGKPPQLQDSLWSGLTDSLAGTPMGVTAENLAEKYGITRSECDEYAVRSQHAYAAAAEAGVFAAEIEPVEVKVKRNLVMMDADEYPRGLKAKLEDMAKLPTVFKKDGTVTPASASGICDGAASLVVASEEACGSQGLAPLARVVAWNRVGCDPSIMGIGPVEAIRGILAKTGLTLGDVGIVEVNEAFAAQYLACEKELGLDREITNANGGAIALGHPLGASGARILAHLTHELIRQKKRYAIGSACIGGGQGIAVLLENAQL
jgi:acetyl-CoA acyltransferase 2